MAKKLWLGNAGSPVNDWSVAANWSPSGVPASGDDVYLERSAVDVDDGLDQSAVLLNSLHIAQSYTGLLGTLTAYLKIFAATVVIGEYDGSTMTEPAGSQRIKLNIIDSGSLASQITILNSASSSYETNLPPIRLLVDNADTDLFILKGKVGVAVELPTETSTLADVQESYRTSQESDADLILGAGVTLTSLKKTGGRCYQGCAGTTIINAGGALYIAGSGAITTLTVEGGKVYPESTGTITTVNADGGEIDAMRCRLARTWTTLAAKAGSTAAIKYDPAIVTVTNKFTPAGRLSMQLASV